MVRWSWVNFQCRGVLLDDSRARAYCACSRCGWGLFGHFWGRSGGAKVLGKLPVPGRPTNLAYSRARLVGWLFWV